MKISRNCFDNILPISFVLIIMFTSGMLRGVNLFIANSGFALMGIFTACVLYISVFYVAYSQGIRKNINLVKPILTMMIMYGVMLTFGTYESINPRATVLGLVYLITFTIFSAVIFDYYKEKEIFKLISMAFVIIAIVNLIFIILFPQYSIDTRDGRFEGILIGMFFHKNSLASFMCIGNVTMLINLLDKNIKGNEKKLYGFTYVITLILTVLANSTTSILMLLVCSGLIVIYKLYKIRFNVIKWLVLFHVLLYTVILKSQFINDLMVKLLGRDLTLTGRVDIWKLLLKIIEDKPWLGYGYDAIWNTREMVYYIHSKFTFEFMGSHNGPIHIILELGIIGFAAFFIIFILIPGIKLKNLDLDNSNLHMFTYVYYAYILMYSVAESTFLPTNFQTLFLILSVLCIMNTNNKNKIQ